MKASWAFAATVAALPAGVLSSSDCYCLPGDSCWPATSSWDSLNSTVGGRLVATVPIGSPCHDPTYDGTACKDLQDDWYLPQTHFVSSSSVMQSYWANQSCDPFTSESRPCLLGNYVSYAVDVRTTDDVAAAIQFAKANNIRFVVRNTGHDYLGRSTGAGALSVWTHQLNDIEYQDWSDSTYQGPAYKLGSGVMGYQVLDATRGTGHVLVGGECPTVGLAGGYTQGGGHSALSTVFGLGADQTLSFEVVTASGDVVTASRTENDDLYWALSGGGAGNYGVVTSVTVKAHPDGTVSGAGLQFSAANITSDVFFEAVERFHTLLPAMVDAGTTVIYQMTDSVFLINPLTAYNKTTAEVKTILAPFLRALTDLGIQYTTSYTSYSSYYDHYNKYMGPLPYGNLEVSQYNYGGRLLPRSTLESNATNLASALRHITQNGVIAVGVGMNVSAANDVPNAVFSPLRNAAVTMQIGSAWNESAPWSQMVDDQWRMTYDYVPALEAVTPGSGAYQNEANFRQLNWQETFFGENYDKLLSIKEKWDPDHFFYVLKGVGSDYWSVADSGRMCKIPTSCSA
ncbi:FAD/FMN-containing dehydrogenase [Aspergillus ambiguus]|uniref:putative isoamyl alcohol oxidase n=1 Tax=Aspergillus ambiguus TaxID=176160 RepID=UPI003CCCBB54